jgi:predicted DNA-binding protein YlxM (UPF0122 family)
LNCVKAVRISLAEKARVAFGDEKQVEIVAEMCSHVHLLGEKLVEKLSLYSPQGQKKQIVTRLNQTVEKYPEIREDFEHCL